MSDGSPEAKDNCPKNPLGFSEHEGGLFPTGSVASFPDCSEPAFCATPEHASRIGGFLGFSRIGLDGTAVISGRGPYGPMMPIGGVVFQRPRVKSGKSMGLLLLATDFSLNSPMQLQVAAS